MGDIRMIVPIYQSEISPADHVRQNQPVTEPVERKHPTDSWSIPVVYHSVVALLASSLPETCVSHTLTASVECTT
jgi:tellurite resistance protein TehA-like permease